MVAAAWYGSEPVLWNPEKASVSLCSSTSVWAAKEIQAVSHRLFSTLLAVSESLA